MTIPRFAASCIPVFLAVVGWGHAQTISSTTRTPVTVTYWTGEQLDKTLVRVNGAGSPGAKYIVETSREGTRWWPISAARADATSGAILWETRECSTEPARQYRLIAAQTDYSTQPQGRLTEPAPGTFALVTEAGWRISINKNAMIITGPASVRADKVELWGSVHENLIGKHIKDIFSHRRSYLLEDGTLITVSIENPLAASTNETPMGCVSFISIYDGQQSHRIDMSDLSVAWSALQPALGEGEEYDGETARIYFNKTGLRFDNVSDQGDPCGPVPERVPGILPLGQTELTKPNTVNDYFDDRRLGHT